MSMVCVDHAQPRRKELVEDRIGTESDDSGKAMFLSNGENKITSDQRAIKSAKQMTSISSKKIVSGDRPTEKKPLSKR